MRYNIVYSEVDGANNYYIYNGQGNVTKILDSSYEISADYTFDAYGNQRTKNEGAYNPFRYNGEYYDSETGYTYLRNRYYDSEKSRFISEDPIRDGLNWYSYCGGNPVMFVDSMGLFYIVKDVTYCSCMDPRCKFYSTPTGTYTVHPDNWGKFTAKNLIGIAPGGTIINPLLELMTNVVDGNSACTGEEVVMESVMELASMGVETLDKLSVAGSKLFKNITKMGSGIYSLKSFAEGADNVYMDQIVFELLERNNISRTSASIDDLKSMMTKAYGFIMDFDEYFSVKYDARGTLFEIDNKLMRAKNPEQTIHELANRYEANLISARINGTIILSEDEIKAYKYVYTAMLEGYQERVDAVNKSFSECIG